MNSTYGYMNFTNVISPESCYINIVVLKPTLLNKLNITCHSQCFITHTSKTLTTNDFIIYGDLVELNAKNITSYNLSFTAINGRFQGNYMDVKGYSNLLIQDGDIVF
jgi:hypothetical protein